MKILLPELSIPPPTTQQIPETPTSITSSIPSVLQTPDDYQDLTIPRSLAALLDPGHERLTPFFGKLQQTDSQYSEFHANPHGPFPVDAVEPPEPIIAEPFAILGSVGRGSPYFIGLDSPHEYDRFIHSGRTIEALRPKKLSTHKSPPRSKVSRNDKPVKRETKPPMRRNKPQPMPPLPKNLYQPEVATPASALTFAAVWDPDEGMATFRGSRLFEATYHAPSNDENVLDDAHVRSRYMVPRTPIYDSRRSRAVASSTLDGLDIYIPRKVSKKGEQNKSKKHYRPPSVDDEGFFETFSDSDHPDCEPHLPSRFSVTTTSTSNYIDVDFPPEGSVHNEPAVPPVPPIPETHKLEKVASYSSVRSAISPPFLLLGRRPSNPSSSTSSFTLPALVRSKSSPARNRPPLVPHHSHQTSSSSQSPSSYKAPKPRFSNVLGKLRRNSQDEGWVSVEVTAVITDRVIKED